MTVYGYGVRVLSSGRYSVELRHGSPHRHTYILSSCDTRIHMTCASDSRQSYEFQCVQPNKEKTDSDAAPWHHL